jgi:sialidase-1
MGPDESPAFSVFFLIKGMNSMRYTLLLSIIMITSFKSYPQGKMTEELEMQVLFSSSMNDSVACYRIPALVTAPNGDLIAAIDERVPSCGDLKWSRDINIVVRRSLDNGNTWTDIERIIDYPDGKSASDPSMIVDRVTGKIFLFYNYMDLDHEKDVYYLHVVISPDNGKSWSEPLDITGQISKAAWKNDFKFIASGRGIQTRDGKLLHCLVNLDHGLHVFGSDDQGESWYYIDTPVIPGNESKIVELFDGRWMINSRLNNPGYRQLHISDDEGRTWDSRPDTLLLDPGCNASIIRYTSVSHGDDKNRLLFSNARDAGGRKNMTVSISYDEGQSWEHSKTIYDGSSAYSSMTILNNGDIGLFFEKDNYSENAFVTFSLKWLTDGQDSLPDDQ